MILRRFQRGFRRSFSTMKFLNQKEAIELDQKLFNQYNFDVSQLMELAGQACANALFKQYPIQADGKGNRILVICGPGNNGGDGIVAARHLAHFGYKPTILYPKKSRNEMIQNLVIQSQRVDVEFINELPSPLTDHQFDVILDGIFGFSYQAPMREPFKAIISKLSKQENAQLPRIMSIDIPSGWNVESGPPADANDPESPCITPDSLISLTAPKLCANYLPNGCAHYLGGRFLPPSLARYYGLELPKYSGSDTIQLL